MPPKLLSAFNKMSFGTVVAGGDTTTGLVSYWPMNDGSGTTFVDGQAVQNGTLSSSGLWTGDYVAFDGVEFGLIPFFGGFKSGAYNFGTHLTAFCWVNGVAQPNTGIFADYDINSNLRSWEINTEATTGVTLRVLLSDDGSTFKKQYVGSQTLLNSIWHSACFRWDAGVLDLFVDGIIDPSPTKITDNALSGNALFFDNTVPIGVACVPNGLGGSPSNIFTGGINRLRLYNIAKSNADILAIHNLGH